MKIERNLKTGIMHYHVERVQYGAVCIYRDVFGFKTTELLQRRGGFIFKICEIHLYYVI